MPKLEKRVLSQYLRVRCDRFLHHSLYRGAPQQDVPLPLAGRPGVQAFKDRGIEFEDQKKGELVAAFGDSVVDAQKLAKAGKSPDKIIEKLLTKACAVPRFLVEPPLSAAITRPNLLASLSIQSSTFPTFPDFRPDLIMVIPSDGVKDTSEILASGAVCPVVDGDTRTCLRVIDMKATEKLNPSYAAEVVAYSMVLAAWLEGMSLAGEFFVHSTPAVWAKAKFFTINIPKESDDLSDKLAWLDAQLLDAEAELYAPSVVKFLSEDIPRALKKDDWRTLDWGVAPTCSQCDYLGYEPWTRGAMKKAVRQAQKLGWKSKPKIADYCYAEAVDGDLAMQIPSLTVGMRRALSDAGLTQLTDVANCDPGDPGFRGHHSLRRESNRLPPKADAILNDESRTHENYRTAQMAGYVDLRLTINVSFDASSQLLIALGLGVDYREPSPFSQPRERPLTRTTVSSFLVSKEEPEEEREQLVDFLRTISNTLTWIEDQHAYPVVSDGLSGEERARYAHDHVRVQAVFWDRRQEEALRQAIGRHLIHLQGQGVLSAAIWLFPPEEVVGSDKTAETPPVCYLRDVLTSLYVLPTVISDDVISVAESLLNYDARLSDFDWDRIGGSIPKERALEIWQANPPKRPPKSLSECRKQYQRTVETLVYAMRRTIMHAVTTEKASFRGSAPLVRNIVPTTFQKVAADALLWLTYHAVEEGVGRLETKITFSGDPHDIESTYSALRTNGRIRGNEKSKLLKEFGLKHRSNRRLFHVCEESGHAKFRDGESFLVLVPEEPVGSALLPVSQYVENCDKKHPDYEAAHWRRWRFARMNHFLGATLVHFDREQLVAVIDWDDFFPDRTKCRSDLIKCGALQLNRPMMLLKTFGWPILDKLTTVAKAIGNPPIATAAEATAPALARVRKPGKSRITPAAEVLWTPTDLTQAETGISIKVESHRAVFDSLAATLPDDPNDSQLEAVRKCLETRLNLVWGGPGTGKTRTLMLAMIADAILSHLSGHFSRTLVSTFSYRALGEIVTRLDEWLHALPNSAHKILKTHGRLSFLLRDGREQELGVGSGKVGGLKTLVFGKNRVWEDGEEVDHISRSSFRSALQRPSERIEIVFAPSLQVLNFANQGNDSPVVGLFDRIWIDESSQLPVAQALPIFALLDEGGSVGVFGDRLQMPPVQRVTPPKGAEHMVGGIQDYLFSRIHEQEVANSGAAKYKESFLNINYRSCEPIVAFSRSVGYKKYFEAFHKNRKLRFDETLAATDWDTDVVPDFDLTRECLDPERPCVAVTYDDGRNGQANEFEAALAAASVLQYRSAEIWQDDFCEKTFWREQVGVVTPHRAQRATIIALLQQALRDEDVNRVLIEDAVDTVERFQGSERDLIIVSFGLGDPDIIQKEEEFLFQKERINVAITRAKAKVILFVTRDLGLHLPEDEVVKEASKTIKHFVYQHAVHKLPRETIEYDGRSVENVTVRYRTYDD